MTVLLPQYVHNSTNNYQILMRSASQEEKAYTDVYNQVTLDKFRIYRNNFQIV